MQTFDAGGAIFGVVTCNCLQTDIVGLCHRTNCITRNQREQAITRDAPKVS
jgi:hypothetical protein